MLPEFKCLIQNLMFKFFDNKYYLWFNSKLMFYIKLKIKKINEVYFLYFRTSGDFCYFEFILWQSGKMISAEQCYVIIVYDVVNLFYI